MRDTVTTYASKIAHDRKTRTRFLAIVIAIAIVVAAGVSWQLHYTGIAAANETYCGEEEHAHTDECYVDGELVCTTSEHVHTVECLVDSADDEAKSDIWDAFSPKLSDDWAYNMIVIAQSQVGYTESTMDFITDADGNQKGYTRYGDWYSKTHDGDYTYANWDGIFAAYCLSYAGVSEDVFPQSDNAADWIAALQEKEQADDELQQGSLYHSAEEGYVPYEGDLVFFDSDSDGTADRVGIVEEIQPRVNEDDDTVSADIFVVEGDYNDMVQEAFCSFTDNNSKDVIAGSTVMGYGLLPLQSTDESTDETQDSLAEEAADAEEDANAEAADAEDTNAKAAADETTATDTDAQQAIRAIEATEATEATEDTEGAEDAEGADDAEGAEDAADADASEEAAQTEDSDEAAFASDAGLNFLSEDTEDAEGTDEDDEDYSIQLLGNSSAEKFAFVESNIGGTNGDRTKNTVYSKNNNNFHVMASSLDPVSSDAKMELDRDNVKNNGSDLITLNKNLTDKATVILMDCSKLCGSSSSNRIVDSTFDENVKGKTGSTIKNPGELVFQKADVVNDRWVDVIVTFDSVRLYNTSSTQYKNAYTGSGEGYSGLKNNKISIGYITDSGLWIGQNYLGQLDDEPTASKRFSASYFTYPLTMDITCSVEVVYHSDWDDVDKHFLQVAADIDIYHNWTDNGKPTSDTGKKIGRFGYNAETFETLSGFSGDYYIYKQNLNEIYSYSKGYVDFQADKKTFNYDGSGEGTSGKDEIHKVSGAYAVTSSNSWQVCFKEGWCSTELQVFNYTTNDVKIVKVDADTGSTITSAAKFRLYKKEGNTIYYYNANDNTESVDWKTNTWDVKSTGSNGQVKFEYLEPGTYYLEELDAPTGYSLLSSPVEFEVTDYGTVTTNDSHASVDSSGSLTLTVEDKKKTNITLQKVDENNTSTTLSGASFRLSKKDGSTTYYYNGTSNSAITWSTSANTYTALTTGSNGTVAINYLEPGTYYLEEMTAPNNYVLLTGTLAFTISESGTLSCSDSRASVSSSTLTLQIKDRFDNNEITIYKQNQYSQYLSGATFQLYKIENGTTYYYTGYSTSTGLATWSTSASSAKTISPDGSTGETIHLSSGTYYLKELTVSSGYDVLADPIEFSVSTDGTITCTDDNAIIGSSGSSLTLTVINEQFRMQIQKRDSTDSQTLSGANIRLYKIEDGTTYYYKYDSSTDTVTWSTSSWDTLCNSGSSNVYNLEPGIYYLEETQSPAGYRILSEPIEFEITSDKNVICTDENVVVDTSGSIISLHVENVMPDTLQIKKVDANTGEPVAGAKFYLFYTDDDGNWYYYCGHGAQIYDQEAECWQYWTIDYGHIPSDNPTATGSMVEPMILESDEDGYLDLSEFEFGNDWGGNYQGFELCYYVLREIEAPDGYEPISKDLRFEYDRNGSLTTLDPDYVTITNDGMAIAVENDPYPYDITLKKVDAATNQLLQDACFWVYKEVDGQKLYYESYDSSTGKVTWTENSDNAHNFVTGYDGNEYGEVQINGLTPGTYYLYEVWPSDDGQYSSVPDPIEFTVAVGGIVTSDNPYVVDDGSDDSTITVKDDFYQRIGIRKVNSSASTGLAGAQFYAYKLVDGVKYYYSNYDTYRLVATWSDDKDDAKLLTTDSSGYVYLEYLTEGTYYLEEVKAPDGFKSLDHDIVFEIDARGVLSTTDEDAEAHAARLDVKNDCFYVDLKKVDEDDETVTLSGAGFELYYISGNTTYYYGGVENAEIVWVTDESQYVPLTTGDDGLVSIQYLKEGTYYLKETIPPSGYDALLEEDIEFAVKDDGSITKVSGDSNVVSFDNSTLTITVKDKRNTYDVDLYKVDADDKTVFLTGAQFIAYKTNDDGTYSYYQGYDSTTTRMAVWTEDRSAALTITSNGKDPVSLQGLEPGTYTLEEIAVPNENYSLLEETITFTINDEGKVSCDSKYASTSPNDGDDDDEDKNELYIDNYQYQPYNFKVYKTDAGDEEVYLGGATFQLYYTDDSGTHYYLNNEASPAEWTTDSEDPNTYLTTTGEDTSDDPDYSDKGYFQVTGLWPGTYTLQEIVAPDDYYLLEEPIEFVLNLDGSLTTDSDDASADAKNGISRIIVRDNPVATYDINFKKVDAVDETITPEGVGFYLCYVDEETGDIYYYTGYTSKDDDEPDGGEPGAGDESDDDGDNPGDSDDDDDDGDDEPHGDPPAPTHATWSTDINEALELTPDEDGYINACGLNPGTYYLYECDVPYGYWAPDTAMEFEILEGGDYKLDDSHLFWHQANDDDDDDESYWGISNDPRIFDVSLYKFDGDTEDSLGKFAFNIYRINDETGEKEYYDGAVSGRAHWTTDESTWKSTDDGLIVDLKGLDPGTYWIEEIDDLISKNWAKMTEAISFAIDYDGNLTCTENEYIKIDDTGDRLVLDIYNYFLYDFDLNKVNENNNALSGATFQLYYTDENNVVYYYTGTNETTREAEWTIDATDPTTCFTTNTTSINFAGLRVGTYYLSELTAPTNYYPLEGPITIEIAKDGTTTVAATGSDKVEYDDRSATITVTNYSSVFDVTICKVDENLGSLGGAVFQVYRIDENGNEQYYCGYDEEKQEALWTDDADAENTLLKSSRVSSTDITLQGLSSDTYYLKEVTAPEDYIGTTSPIIFTLDKNGNLECESAFVSTEGLSDGVIYVINYKTKDYYDVTFEKVDGSSGNFESLTGAAFQLYYIDDNNQKMYYCGEDDWETEPYNAPDGWSVDNDGTITFTHLDAPGDYYLQEVKAPDGYYLIQDALKFSIDLDGDIIYYDSEYLDPDPKEKSPYVYVSNYEIPKYDISFQKVDADTRDWLNGATFQLYYIGDDGKSYYYHFEEDETTWTTDKNSATEVSNMPRGQYFFYDLEPHEYHLIEVVAPSGYATIDDITFTLNDDGTVTSNDPNMDTDVEDFDGQIKNSIISGRELPNAGGSGTTLFTLIGLALVGGAGALLVNQRKKRQTKEVRQ